MEGQLKIEEAKAKLEQAKASQITAAKVIQEQAKITQAEFISGLACAFEDGNAAEYLMTDISIGSSPKVLDKVHGVVLFWNQRYLTP